MTLLKTVAVAALLFFSADALAGAHDVNGTTGLPVAGGAPVPMYGSPAPVTATPALPKIIPLPTPGVSEGSAGGAMPSEIPSAPGMSVPPPDAQAPVAACPHQDWVGKHIKQVDLNSIKGPVRILYPDSPMTMDYSADRMNFVLDKKTDIILQVTCG